MRRLSPSVLLTLGMKTFFSQSLLAGRDRFWTRGAYCIWVNKIALKKIAVSDFPRNFFLAENFPSKNRLCAIFWVPRGIVPCVIRRPGWPLFIDKMYFVKSEYTIFFSYHVSGMYNIRAICSNNTPSRSKHTNPLHIAYTMIVP
jgi:hypothetical protein